MTPPHSGYDIALSAIGRRAANAVVNHAGLRSTAANAALLRRLGGDPGAAGAMLGDPVFEASRVWKPAQETLADLAGDVLSEELVAALGGAGENRVRAPYVHQLAAWKAAREGKSYMVTSGTGSGKTECFMVPMLDDLVRESAVTGRLRGVRALVLYPLNALIESQKERLGAWTEPFQDRLSYALYNGNMPERSSKVVSAAPGEIACRQDLRKAPPPVLVTNVTMLEYMLLRTQDQPILAASQGKLRWIVLDEAHTYVGARAAEMALLLRRVREAFQVDPKDVRLVATSATIGEGEETRAALRRFVADLGGVDISQVEVIEGEEIEPALPPEDEAAPLNAAALDTAESAEAWSLLASHPKARELRRLARSGGLRMSVAQRVLGVESAGPVWQVLEAAARAIDPASVETGAKLRFLPWRLHIFHRAQGGVWACVDPACSHRDPELTAKDAEWPFGQIHVEQRERCDCGAPVFELAACRNCGEAWLHAQRQDSDVARLVQPRRNEEVDEFSLDAEPEPETEDEDRVVETPLASSTVWLASPRQGARARRLRLADAVLPDGVDGAPSVLMRIEEECDCCTPPKRTTPGRLRYGSPFLMGNAMPLLLAEAPGAGPSAAHLPAGGRRLISFTDSRQGTARFAAKLQQEAERTLTRAVAWRAVWETPAQAPLDPKDAIMIAQMRANGMGDMADEFEARQRGNAPPPGLVKWDRLRDRLATTPDLQEKIAGEVWRNRSYGAGWGDLAADNVLLADLFLCREFFRRPRLQSNAETMGLARLAFPEMEKAAAATVPAAFAAAGKGAEDWVGFLLLAVDQIFRNDWAIDVSKQFQHWISPRQGLRAIREQDAAFVEGEGSIRRWPAAKDRRKRLVLMLAMITGLDLRHPADASTIDDLLQAAWMLLRKHGVITQIEGYGWRQSFAKAALARMERAWLCPVTRMLVPYSAGGLSPLAPEAGLMTEIALPRPPLDGDGKVDDAAIFDWLNADPTVAAMRPRCLWNNLHDRAAANEPYFRAQEHSAQIDRESLGRYEDEFRKGRINVLNCSTTMEMGVDIADVGVVANTNVPPSASNYRQRVGRAGRRGEPWAIAFTFCKDKPLDWEVFHDPSHLLHAQIAAPAVHLASASLARKHVNSFLLGTFLRDQGGMNLKTGIGAFFGARRDVDEPLMEGAAAERFIASLHGEWARSDAIAAGLRRLLRGTPLAAIGIEAIVERCATDLDAVRHVWREEYLALLLGFEGAKDQAETKWHEHQLKGMEKAFMISELVKRGLTPGYGFPIDVVRFDHVGDDRDGPSRQLEVAIRDYAPGAEVVRDGLVYRSAGVMPAWADRNSASNVEDLQTLWFCRDCGAFRVERARHERCPSCDGALDTRRILRPAGFLSEGAPHAGYESIVWTPPRPTMISLDPAAWEPLASAEAGRTRASGAARLVYQAAGPAGEGFALCIACGRAEAETGDNAPLPSGMADHFPLRAPKDQRRHDGRCSGSDIHSLKIQRHVRLGREVLTDAFEFQIEALRRKEDIPIARAVAAGLREALARSLGVEGDDIGVSALAGRREDGDLRCSAVLFDRAQGGAGLSPLAADRIEDLIEGAITALDCKNDCKNGCPECILRGDLQYEQDGIDRRGALALLRDDVRPHLAIAPEDQAFGAQTQFARGGVVAHLGRLLARDDLRRAVLIPGGSPTDWDLHDWLAAPLFPRCGAAGAPLDVVLSATAFATLESVQKRDLARLLAQSGGRAGVALNTKASEHGAAQALCHALTASGWRVLASRAECAVDETWGVDPDLPTVHGPAETELAVKWLDTEELFSFYEPNAHGRDIRTELDGPVANFGASFWQVIKEMRPSFFLGGRRIVELRYEDRYLRAPLPVRLLREVVRATPVADRALKVFVETCEARNDIGRLAGTVTDNWCGRELQLQTISALLPGAMVEIRRKSEMPHARTLHVIGSDGARLSIRPDQGFGAWWPRGAVACDVLQPPAAQAGRIASAAFVVRREGGGTGSPISLREIPAGGT